MKNRFETDSKTYRSKISWAEFVEDRADFVTVEHIFPKNARHAYWHSRFGYLTAKQRTLVRDSLGNLLPLSRPKNSALSNRPFPEKATAPQESVVSYKYGSYAENEVAHEREWTPETILHRGLKLLSFMEKRWELNLGTEEDKVAILGLSFLRR